MDQIAARSDGQVQFEGVRGSLYGPVRAQRAVILTPQARVSLTDVALDWDLRALWDKKLRITALRVGHVRIEHEARAVAAAAEDDERALPIAIDVQHAEAATLQVHWAKRDYRLHDVQLSGRVEAGTIAWALRANAGRLALDGELEPAESGRFDLRATVKALDLAEITEAPASRLTGRFHARGAASPTWHAQVQAALADSEFNGMPVHLNARADVAGLRVQALKLDGRLGGNSITAHGAFGQQGDVLEWHADMPKLSQLGPGFAGRLRADGRLRDSVDRPTLRFSIEGHALRVFNEHRIDRISGAGRLEGRKNAPFEASLTVRGYRRGDWRVERAAVRAAGRQRAHTLELDVKTQARALRLAAHGAWHEGQWRGDLTRARVEGEERLRLLAPAPLEVTKTRWQVRDARVAGLGGTFAIASLERAGEQWRSRGTLTGIRARDLQAAAGRPLPLRTTLELGGEWQVTADRTLEGALRVWRESGDVTLDLAPPRALGLEQLVLDVRFSEGRARGHLEVAGARAGTLRAQGELPLVRADGAWRIDANAPFALDASARWSSIAWMAAFTPEARFDGRLNIEVQGRGSLGSPNWQGSVSGEALSFGVPQQGVALRNGVLDAVLHDDRLTVRRLQFEGPEGRLDASGTLSLREERGRIRFTAEQLLVSRLPRRELVVSGGGTVALQDQRLRVNAAVTVDRGSIELPKHDAPTLSDDVVIVGREQPAAAPQKVRFKPEIDVKIGLGEKFYLKGRGLDARLAGELRVRSAEQRGLLLASGQIRVAEGRYAAYGQRLAIERGVLTFSGPVDNPALDILALRKNQKVHAGVAITGTVQQPVVRLVSIPEVPDSEKLAWLVLGRGLESTTKQDLDLLGAAAGALLARGESVSLQAKIAQRTGLDEFRLAGSGDLESAVVRLGKRLSSDLYVSYERSLVGTTNLFQVRYDLTERWAVQTQTGTDKSAVDLLFTLPFD